ncbi:hypothetical protein [Enterococcus sp. AZ109]|uniref:hypothetical protein n=1 Tax=Enterococcus sp. AZ109 TaxID=2774634 RepID=UPI003F215804
MNRYRWRRIVEIAYREERKKFHYFNRKSYKKIYQIWVRAKRLGLTELSHSEFTRSILAPTSRGVTITEMEMNLGKLEQHLKNYADKRRETNGKND